MNPPEPVPDPQRPRPGTASGRGAFGARVLRRLAGRPEPAERYLHEGEIARGGQGVVLRVWDQDLQRPLAMKVVLDDGSGSSRVTAGSEKVSHALGRFLEEAHVTGRLEHPGIVPVHELGLDAEGHVYFTMKLVNGRDLGAVFELVREGREGWTRARALSVMLRVCEALAYAHSKGVIHRDLKPANVMVGEYGEVYVMDWGLARVLGVEDRRDLGPAPGEGDAGPASPLLTLDGDVVGTPAYMSPEQAVGDLDAMGPPADVYAAGAMLYELLAGHMPYAEPGRELTVVDVWNRVREGPPAPLHERAPDAPAELCAICEKAMAREIGRRYPDMEALAADLRAFQEQRVVSAYETGAVAELRKWVARNRHLAASLAAAVLAVVGGLLWVQNERAVRRQEAVSAALARSEREREVDSGVSLALGQAEVHVEQGQWDAAQASIEGARALASTVEAPGERLAGIAEREAALERAREAARFEEDVEGIAQRIDVLFDWAETDAAYVARFSELGIDVDGSTAAEVVAALAERGVAGEVVPSLDRWLVVRLNLERQRAEADGRGEDLSGAEHLVAVTEELDRDPLRADLRAALVEDDVERLSSLAREDLGAQPPSTIALLGTALKLAGAREEALAVLRRGVLHHPGDYGLRTTLLTHLRQNPITPGWDRAECREALVHTQAALALRPSDPDLRLNTFWGFMGLAWDAERQGDTASARPRFEAALAQLDVLHGQRFFRSELLFRAWAQAGAGREDLAVETLSGLVREPPPFAHAHGRSPEEWRTWYFTRAGSFLLRHGALEDALLAFEPLLDTDAGPAYGEWTLARVLLEAREGDPGSALDVLHECLEWGPHEAPRAAYWTAWSVARLPSAVLLDACGASTSEERVRLGGVLAALRDESLQLMEGLDEASVRRFRLAASAPPWPTSSQPRPTILGMLRYRCGDPAGCVAALEGLEGKNAYEWYFLALARQELGDAAGARADLGRALADTAEADLTTRGWEDLADFLLLREEAEAALGIARGH